MRRLREYEMTLSLPEAHQDESVLVARPNRSATPALLAGTFIGLVLFSTAVVTFSIMQGNLLALPFAVIDLLALGGCLLLSWRSGDDEDRIERRGDSLIVERWRRRQHDHIEFNVYWTRAWLGPGRYPGRPGRVLLGSHGKTVEVGSFLAEDERKRLLESIRTVLTSVQARPTEATTSLR